MSKYCDVCGHRLSANQNSFRYPIGDTCNRCVAEFLEIDLDFGGLISDYDLDKMHKEHQRHLEEAVNVINRTAEDSNPN